MDTGGLTEHAQGRSSVAMNVDRLDSFERRQEAKLSLAGYRKLYETQLRAERKSGVCQRIR
jgi:hypothetical protein